jgi:hypothetical protein
MKNENILNFEQEIITSMMVMIDEKVKYDVEYMRYLHELLSLSRVTTRKWDSEK